MSHSDLQAQHNELIDLLTQLEAATARGAAIEVLDAIATFLPEHFAFEEAPRGVMIEIELKSPAHAKDVAALRAEHQQMLQQVAELQEAARSADEQAWPASRQAVDAFVALARGHERVEGKLIADVQYEELGEQD